MPIEVYGVIYLYNPVSIKRLGLDKVTENTEVSDKVETPAATEPVPAPQPDATAPANLENVKGDPNTAGAPANAAAANPAAPANPAGPAAPVNPNGAQPANPQ
jgi:hypothetical protein